MLSGKCDRNFRCVRKGRAFWTANVLLAGDTGYEGREDVWYIDGRFLLTVASVQLVLTPVAGNPFRVLRVFRRR